MLSPGNVGELRHAASGKVQLYGWDSATESWHGPDELDCAPGGTSRILTALRRAPGNSWYGAIRFLAPDEPDNRFFALIHDLEDCAVAMIYCDDSKAGPAEIIAVLPAARRSRLRAEFPFEFVAFTGFLRSTNATSGHQLYERMNAALAETGPSDSLIFSITTGLWPDDMGHVLSRCSEAVAMAMLRWAGGLPGDQ